MLVIRLFRVGKKNQPSFKIVVTDKKNPPRGGRFVEQVGFYNPLTKEKTLNKERIQYWLSQGAQPSDTIHNLLVKEGILEAKKISVHKKPKKKEEKTEEKPAEKPAETKAAEAKPQPAEKKEEISKQEEPKKEEQSKTEKPQEEKTEEKPTEEKKEESKPEEGR